MLWKRCAMLSDVSRNRSTQFVRHVSVRPSSRDDGLSGKHLSQHVSVSLFTCRPRESDTLSPQPLTWFWNCSFCCSWARKSCNSLSAAEVGEPSMAKSVTVTITQQVGAHAAGDVCSAARLLAAYTAA